jgi:hypothetical protein
MYTLLMECTRVIFVLKTRVKTNWTSQLLTQGSKHLLGPKFPSLIFRYFVAQPFEWLPGFQIAIKIVNVCWANSNQPNFQSCPMCSTRGMWACDSKIPWYPKLLFQRENALASFWVQRVLVTQPRPYFALRHFRIEIKPSVSGLCWDTKTLSGVAKITSKVISDSAALRLK